MMSIDEALSTIIGATYTRWIEHRTESGNWSRRQHQKTRRILSPSEPSTNYATTAGAPPSAITSIGRLNAAPKKPCGYASSSPIPKESRYSA